VPNFSVEFFDRWEHLISDMEISDVPIRFIKSINANLKNGAIHSFEIDAMIKKGIDYPEIETLVENYLGMHDEDIECVDFHLNINAIADEVETKTNKLLD
jgi:hypothetical protein